MNVRQVFFALGIAKQKKKPVVLLCTSGTASANYLPAIVEAHYSHTPLIVLTADRPPYHQECHAGQTINQTGIYNAFVNWQSTLETPQLSLDYLCYLRETIKSACIRAIRPQPGVVHLNVPFDEPLTPEASETNQNLLNTYVASNISAALEIPSEVNYDSVVYGLSEKLIDRIQGCQRLLFIAGPGYYGNEDSVTHDIIRLCRKLSAPILADALNPLRNNEEAESLTIHNYEFLLRSENLLETLKPDLVLQFGDLPTSKTLRTALTKWNPDLIRLGASFDNQDPSFSQLIAEGVSIAELNSRVLLKDNTGYDYLGKWADTDKRITTEKSVILGELLKSTESVLCHELSTIIDAPCNLFVSNSMIIRDMEVFWRGNKQIDRVFSNRGANGIDGIVSTAFGVAKSEKPLLCLIGDLAFFHDSGGLLLRKQLENKQRVAFILLDNKGGGIFEHLPISKLNPPFESHFATPQDVDVQKLCEAYHVQYQHAVNLESLGKSIQSFLSGKTHESLCLHLKYNRKESYEIRKTVASRVASLLNQL